VFEWSGSRGSVTAGHHQDSITGAAATKQAFLPPGNDIGGQWPPMVF
jgi:hypothetical protein